MKRFLKNFWRENWHIILVWVAGSILWFIVHGLFFTNPKPDWHTQTIVFEGTNSKYAMDTNQFQEVSNNFTKRTTSNVIVTLHITGEIETNTIIFGIESMSIYDGILTYEDTTNNYNRFLRLRRKTALQQELRSLQQKDK
jgi:hypothetical protein